MFKEIEVDFTIESLSPIMFNKYIDEKAPKTQEGYREQAERKCHRNKDGYICITSEMLLAAIREAVGNLAPRGKAKPMRREIMAGLFFKEEYFLTGKKEYDFIDERPVIRGKGEKTTLVICYRPVLKEWKISGTMILIDLQKQLIEEALKYAGVKIGLGSYRPRFGRFFVSKFEEKKK